MSRPVLYFHYFSRNLIWSIYLIIKEKGKFPRLIYIEDLDRYEFLPSAKKMNIYFSFLLKIINITKISILPNKLLSYKLSPNDYKWIKLIYENNIAWHFKSLFVSTYTNYSESVINILYICYLRGKYLSSKFPDADCYFFNGRKAPLYCFIQGISSFSNINYIEITNKNNQKYIYSSSCSLWSMENINFIESKYGFGNDLSFYHKREYGLDFYGRKWSKKQSYIGPQLDILYFFSTAYEFVGFGYDSRQALELIKFSFREIVKFSRLGYRCAIRNHPNFNSSSFKDKKLFSKWFKILEKEGVKIIDYDDDTSSYSLASKARIIFTIGSAIGGELAYKKSKIFDFGPHKSFPFHFNLVPIYDFKLALDSLSSEIKSNHIKYNIRNFERFASFYSGYGHKIPRIFQLFLK